MSETNAEKDPARVKDRRRFDPDGNPRQDEAEEASAVAGSSPEPHPLEQEVARLQQELETARKRVDELARAYQALQTDREEFKQRLTRERERLLDVEKGTAALPLVEAIDELDLALQAAGQEATPLSAGVKLIRDKLLAQVAALGIERIRGKGETFDPAWAEAADMEVTTDPAEDQRVVEELRAGYRLKDRVIRPARVRVAKYVAPAHA